MDIKHKSKILDNLEVLARKTDLTRIVPVLIARNLIDQQEVNKIKDINGEFNKNKYFYTLILNRSLISFDSLGKILEETRHYELVNLLTNENMGTNINALHPLANAEGIRCVRSNTSLNQFITTRDSNSKYQPETDLLYKPIVVRKATEFKDELDCGPAKYPMSSNNRGIYLIINNIKFDDDAHDERFGAEADHNNLLNLFGQMQFSGEDYQNQSRDEMINILDRFSQLKSMQKPDCCIIVIMSHGIELHNKCYLISSDNQFVDTDIVKDFFNNINCPKLHNIPKVFIFQCCRGDKTDKGVVPERLQDTSENRVSTDGNRVKLPTYSDMLLCFSTVTGFASFRESLTGTWYIETICDVWSKNAYQYHVVELMQMVQDQIQTRMTKDNELQTTTMKNIAFRTCYLHPGLYKS